MSCSLACGSEQPCEEDSLSLQAEGSLYLQCGNHFVKYS